MLTAPQEKFFPNFYQKKYLLEMPEGGFGFGRKIRIYGIILWKNLFFWPRASTCQKTTRVVLTNGTSTSESAANAHFSEIWSSFSEWLCIIIVMVGIESVLIFILNFLLSVLLIAPFDGVELSIAFFKKMFRMTAPQSFSIIVSTDLFCKVLSGFVFPIF